MGLRVVVWSDYNCPFCFLGRERVARLRRAFPDAEVAWRAFEIHPGVPAEGAPLETVLSPERLRGVRATVDHLARESGVDMAAPAVVANTRKAHAAAELARSEGRFEAFHDGVFNAYWREGRNIGDVDVLVDVWTTQGGDGARLRAHLDETTADSYTVPAMEAGVRGVPTFDFHGRRGARRVVGAQPFDVLRAAAKEVTDA